MGLRHSQGYRECQETFADADDLDGFEDLKEEDQEKLKAAWEVGRVADEDIPATSRKEGTGDEEEEKPKKRASKKEREANDDE